MNEIYRNNTDNIVAAYHKYKAYYDRKAKAQPLEVNDLVFLLDPNRTEDSDIFDSHIPTQTKINTNSDEPETDEETPVERVIRLKTPDYQQAIRHDRPLNRLPNRLSLTPQPGIIIDDLPRNARQVQFNEKDEIIPQEITEDTAK